MRQLAVHEVIELHELLDEKISMVDHLGLYIAQSQDAQLKSMLQSHQHRTMQDYQMILGVLQGQGGYVSNYGNVGMATGGGITPNLGMNTGNFTGGQSQVQYGMVSEQKKQPQPITQHLSDKTIAQGCLTFHKSGATRATAAALECSNAQMRSVFCNSARACTDMAYDTFQYMNHKGWYQIPMIESNQFKHIIDAYQMPQQDMYNQSAPEVQPQGHFAQTAYSPMGTAGYAEQGQYGNW